MVEAVIADLSSSGGDRLNALAITRPNQTGNIGRAHPPTRLVAKALEKWVKPTLQIGLPIRVHHQPPLKLAPHESRIRRKRNPKNHISAKVVLDEVQRHPVSRWVKWMFNGLFSGYLRSSLSLKMEWDILKTVPSGARRCVVETGCDINGEEE
jgi:hypothetical protein